MSNLPESWKIVKLGDISNITYGKGLPTKNLKSRGFPVFGANGIIGFYDKYLYEKSQLLISCRGANSGTINTSPPHCFITNNSLIVDFPVEQETLRRIYYYFLQTANKERLVTGTAQPQVTINNAIEIELPLPPLNEQKRIVAKIEELFSELDKGIESLRIAREQLKVYRQAVLKHAFEGKLTAKWREENKDKLETAEQLLERIKKERQSQGHNQLRNRKNPTTKNQKPSILSKPKEPKLFLGDDFLWLSKLPENWMWERLGWMTGGVTYGTSTKSIKSGKIPVLRMGNIQNMKFDWTDLVYTSDIKEIDSYTLKPGDVLFNRTNSPELVGKTAIYKGERPALYAGYLIRINQIESIVDSQYLNFYLNSYFAKQHANMVKTDGVNQSNINGEKLVNYPFPYCSLEEQRVIVTKLEEHTLLIEQMEENVAIAVQKAEALRQSILKKAFSGKFVTQDPNDEPASLLLDRIRSDKELQKASRKKPLQAREKTYDLVR